jgi:hypothetical protein
MSFTWTGDWSSDVCSSDLEGYRGTEDVNQHPVCILYADKIRSLTMSEDNFYKAYNWAQDLQESKPTDVNGMFEKSQEA